jgi:hypothetical protein
MHASQSFTLCMLPQAELMYVVEHSTTAVLLSECWLYGTVYSYASCC